MRFRAQEAGPHWRGWEWLAVVCEGAALWPNQAEAARLVVSGCPWPTYPRALSAVLGERASRQRAKQLAWDAGIRIRRYRRDLAAEHRRQAVALLGCVANVRRAEPARHVYAEKWGWTDREPVRLHSRLDGEHPDDLIRHPLRFLRDLGRLRAASFGASAEPGG